ncbi:MAG: DUF554 domain-containing protein [Selenomonadaceae bacterium]|nr:DUF554 domain-containing protein [Selenomonadaceae bacterium]
MIIEGFAGFGTVVNVVGIIFGGVVGLIGGRLLTKKLQDTLQMSCAVAVIFIGASCTLSKMLKINADDSLEVVGIMMMIASLTLGGLIGEIIDIDGHMERFGVWLRSKTGNDGDSRFVDGFVTASLTVCIGAMAVIGAIEDRLLGNYTILYAKAVLDLIIILVMTASMGKGCIFSAVSVGIFQGTITLLAGFLQPLMTDIALSNLSYIGNILIFCVGINLMFGQKIRVANFLPSLIIASAWTC